MLCQLINRCENTRRPYSNSTKRKLGEDGKLKKILNSDSYGCVRLNYLPNFSSDNDESEQKTKKIELQEYYSQVHWKHEKVDSLMDDTYVAQRLLIVGNVEFEAVIKEFPFLAVSLYFLKHARKLMGFDVLQRLVNSIEDKGPEIIKCVKNCQTLDVDKFQVIEVLCDYFTEDKNQFLMIFEVGTTLVL